ncbi:methyltransferase dimerization domain-containing protein [Nonomuraea antimicrobica]
MPLFFNPLEAAAHRLSIVPPMFDYFGALGLHAIIAAARTGIFDALSERPRTGGELATDLGLDPRRTEALLRALTGLGYLRARGGRYRLARTARLWLTTGSPTSLVAALEFWERTACVIWPRLEEAIRDGSPPRRSTRCWRATRPWRARSTPGRRRWPGGRPRPRHGPSPCRATPATYSTWAAATACSAWNCCAATPGCGPPSSTCRTGSNPPPTTLG